ncbi:MAG: hypothetical protein KA354_12530 [Phycisphaerae bacterium]|nr:hypothetical protein [Phycisphaerae bacterium]
MEALLYASRSSAFLVVLVVLSMVPASTAQQNRQAGPRIGYVYPAGGRQGSTFQVVLGGQNLDGVNSVHVNGDGVEGMVIEHRKPLTQLQFSLLREKLKELMDKKAAAQKSRSATRPAWTDEDEKAVAELRKKLANPPNRQANPAIAETVLVEVTVGAGAEPGERELRLEAQGGLTNPIVFCVGQLPEFSEPEEKPNREPPGGRTPKSGNPLNPRRGLKAERDAPGLNPEEEMTVTLPAVVNGQIMPGDVDRFRFRARKGTRLVAAVAARDLIPYLADGVPGWFQATLAIHDAAGQELGYEDDYRFHPDPVLLFQVPRDGEYVVEIKDSIYRGREDFVYRITLGEFPFVTSVFPLGGREHSPISAELTGWNLPGEKKTMDIEGQEAGVGALSVKRGPLVSNRVLFAVDSLPECLENEPNDRPDAAQSVKLPIIVNGRIDSRGDQDVFRFEGRSGQEVVAEVCARRLGSPLDAILRVTDAAGKQLAVNDDHEDKSTGLNTHHADSWLRITLPVDGTYDVQLADTQDKGGPEHAYRLRISAPRPDFELRGVPSSLNVRGGASAALTVYALRKDGFSGEIELALKDGPTGFKLSGGRVPANQDQVRITLTVPPMRLEGPVRLVLEGRAVVGDRKLVRPVVPAEDMMQAFAYRHLVPAKELLLTTSGRWLRSNAVKIVSAMPVKIPTGGTVRVQVGAAATAFRGKVQLELSNPPDGIMLKKVVPNNTGVELVLQSDAAKNKPGSKGNLIITAFADREIKTAKGAQGTKRRVPVGLLPAVPYEIVAK